MTTTPTRPATPAASPDTAAPAAPTAPTTPARPSVGTARTRVDGPLKVTGTAPYAYEHEVPDPCYVWPVLSTVARGRVARIDTDAAEAVADVLAVLTHQNAPRLKVRVDPHLWVLQTPDVHYRGQIVAAVIAQTPHAAREAALLVSVEYDEEPADLTFDLDHPEELEDLAEPDEDSAETKGDPAAGWAEAVHRVDEFYAHHDQYHAQMEPHAAIAVWHDAGLNPRATRLTLWDTNQGALPHMALLPPLLGLLPHQLEILSPHVGGGFGGKAMPHPHLVMLALAARVMSPRPVKIAMSRRHMFSLVGHRPASGQHVKLGADSDGRLTAVEHVSTQAVARVKASVDSSINATRIMYATPNRHTEQRLVTLDVPPGTWMRAPGEFTGMFALETAMDELAHAAGLDPVELRVRNEPEEDPHTGQPWSSRALVPCLRRGAELFGWHERRAPGQRREGEWEVGVGVASATFANQHTFSGFARVTYAGGRYEVRLQAADLGTGARTVLAQIAADALRVPPEAVEVHLGHSDAPIAFVAGGSSGTYEWGNAIVAAAARFRRKYGDRPAEGATVRAQGRPPRGAKNYSRHAFGAQFAEVAVSTVTSEVRVRRLVGVYAAGVIVNPLTARSQIVGSMTMALSGALHEESYRDPRYGHIVNGDLAGYHVAAHADIPEMEVEFLPERDTWFGAVGSKGLGELAMVGTPAAIGNAVFNATGRRLRTMPFTPRAMIEAE